MARIHWSPPYGLLLVILLYLTELAVLSILVNTELRILAKCLVEPLEVVPVLGNLRFRVRP